MIITSRLLTFLIALVALPTTVRAYSHSKEPTIAVAMIDTGADVHHPSLQAHLWRNPGEIGVDNQGRDKSKNGLDDDGNGFIDDVNGWNFAGNNSDLTDLHGHGTHIAGIITGAQPARVMVLKAFDPELSGEQVLHATVSAIYYAIRMRAQIINYSGGGSEKSPEEKAALQLASKLGILVVAAAGNERANADINGFYPAAYKLPNILSVAAVDVTGALLPSSNYGVNTVDLAAPGQVLSTLPRNQFGEMTGTSQATALVTRTAVLVYANQLWSKSTPAEIIKHLVSTADKVQELVGKMRNPVVLNTVKALRFATRLSSNHE
jgi:subtilisin family serine protease